MAQYRQELFCDWTASVLGSFYALEMATVRKEGRIAAIEPIAGQPVHRAWDLGIGDDTSVWKFQVVGARSSCLALGDDRRRSSGIASVIEQRTPSTAGHRHRLGAARRQGQGVRHRPHPHRDHAAHRPQPDAGAGVPVQDGINAVRRTLPFCVFHPRCEDGGHRLWSSTGGNGTTRRRLSVPLPYTIGRAIQRMRFAIWRSACGRRGAGDQAAAEAAHARPPDMPPPRAAAAKRARERSQKVESGCRQPRAASAATGTRPTAALSSASEIANWRHDDRWRTPTPRALSCSQAGPAPRNASRDCRQRHVEETQPRRWLAAGPASRSTDDAPARRSRVQSGARAEERQGVAEPAGGERGGVRGLERHCDKIDKQYANLERLAEHAPRQESSRCSGPMRGDQAQHLRQAATAGGGAEVQGPTAGLPGGRAR